MWLSLSNVRPNLSIIRSSFWGLIRKPKARSSVYYNTVHAVPVNHGGNYLVNFNLYIPLQSVQFKLWFHIIFYPVSQAEKLQRFISFVYILTTISFVNNEFLELLYFKTLFITAQKHIQSRNSHWRCSMKKVLLEILQNSQENACVRVSFLIKLIKKETLAQVLSCEFCEISKNTFLTEHIWTTASVRFLSSIYDGAFC